MVIMAWIAGHNQKFHVTWNIPLRFHIFRNILIVHKCFPFSISSSRQSIQLSLFITPLYSSPYQVHKLVYLRYWSSKAFQVGIQMGYGSLLSLHSLASWLYQKNTINQWLTLIFLFYNTLMSASFTDMFVLNNPAKSCFLHIKCFMFIAEKLLIIQHTMNYFEKLIMTSPLNLVTPCTYLQYIK